MSSVALSRQVEAYSYSVFQLVTDEVRGTSVPVGVALWSSSGESHRVRIPRSDERVTALTSTARLMLEMIQEKIAGWVRSKELPYSPIELRPNTDDWWRHVSSLLVHRIRLSSPLPIDCKSPEQEIELLFEAVVGPQRTKAERLESVDRVLAKTLGSVGRKLNKGSISGFGGRPVPFKKFRQVGSTIVIVDAVNLATTSADTDTDVLVSKVQRVLEANGASRRVKPVIGYLASPNGLNGEAALVQWIQTKLHAQTFDLLRESEAFASSVESELIRA